MTIIKTPYEGVDVITDDFTDFDTLTLEEQIDYIETENRLFYAERMKRRQAKERARRNKPICKITAILGVI